MKEGSLIYRPPEAPECECLAGLQARRPTQLCHNEMRSGNSPFSSFPTSLFNECDGTLESLEVRGVVTVLSVVMLQVPSGFGDGQQWPQRDHLSACCLRQMRETGQSPTSYLLPRSTAPFGSHLFFPATQGPSSTFPWKHQTDSEPKEVRLEDWPQRFLEKQLIF